MGKVFEEQAQFSQALGGHEVGVVDDGDQHFASAVDAEGLLNQGKRHAEPRRASLVDGVIDVTNFFPIVDLAFLSSQGFSRIAALTSASARLRRDKSCLVTE